MPLTYEQAYSLDSILVFFYTYYERWSKTKLKSLFESLKLWDEKDEFLALMHAETRRATVTKTVKARRSENTTKNWYINIVAA